MKKKLIAILSIMTVNALKIRLNQQNSLLCRTIASFNEETLQNLKTEQHVIVNAIWNEVLKKAEDEMNEKTDEYEIEIDKKKFLKKKICF